MSAIDAVGALPGGGEFVTLWQQVEGDPGAVDGLAGVLRTGAEELTHVSADVTRSVSDVHGGWRGAAATAFTSYMHDVSAAAREVDTALAKAGTQLRTAAEQLEAARERMTAIAGRILDQYNAQPADVREANAEIIVRLGCEDAAPVVQQVSDHLQQVAHSLQAAAEIEGFTPLHAAGGRGYLPAPGKPIRWTALPKDGGHAPTSGPASGSGGAGAGDGAGGTGDGAGGAGGSGGPSGPMPTGNVKDWIAQASKILEANGVPASRLNAADINMIIQHESSGNPHAENLTDSNAAAGHPSKGLMQCIDSTFNAHALPGHTDIWNPVDNIVAGVRYAISRYGSLDNVPGVAAVHDGRPYVGY